MWIKGYEFPSPYKEWEKRMEKKYSQNFENSQVN